MSEHTPGPWYVGRSEIGYIVCNVGSLEVVTNEYDPEQYDVEADARLIAAAPDLLEAAEIIEDRDYMDNSGDMAKLRRAIAKAKGDQ